MQKLKWQVIALTLLCFFQTAFAQNNYKQTLRGLVIDKEAKVPMIGATISVTSVTPLLGTTTDIDGQFRMDNIPVGRHNLVIQYIGYEPIYMNDILLSSGKELVLNIEMTESATSLDEVVVSAKSQFDKSKPLNEMAVVSARSFSVEETSRYANSLFDPSRMAQNYAGVTIGAGVDLFNEIVIRGNSPSGVLWRLEGIQIPNPNHFGSMGNSGGAISMLSSSTLTNSDFYTGAFPSEFGNALSGVFDLKMRNGNNEKREYALMFGALGIELAAEGPFSKKSKASYLVNYRYSTLAALQAVGLSPTEEVLPKYQDLSFNVNIPTQRTGIFKLFGLAGKNTSTFNPTADSTQWLLGEDKIGFVEHSNMGLLGLSHRLLLPRQSYLKTVVMASYEDEISEDYYLDQQDNYKKITDFSTKPVTQSLRFNTTYHRKIDARNALQLGAVMSYQQFSIFVDDYDEEQEKLLRLLENEGSTGLLQAFAQWKHRINEGLTLNTGLHYSQMTMNNKFSIEPRAALSWSINKKHSLSVAAGLHSKQEHLGIYLFDGKTPEGDIIQNKKHLGLTKAFHAVLAYDVVFSPKLRLKTELYYQHLYNIPVSKDTTSTFAITNAFDIWEVISQESATNKGLGRNVGLDVTLEKFFSDNYYFMLTGSLYDSKYKPADGEWYNTRFNGHFQLNTLGGKEWKAGKSKKNIFAINGKFVIGGGSRYTPVDVEASLAQGKQVLDDSQTYSLRTPTYYRFDLGLSYKINKKRMTHSIMIDIQNITNRENVAFTYFNEDNLALEQVRHPGLFPTFNYRVEF